MTTGDSFTHAIRAKAQPIWDCELKHPFVRGLGDGTLPIDRFRFYLAQDYVFLIEYCRVFGIWRSQSARPPDDWSIYALPRRDAQHRDENAS